MRVLSNLEPKSVFGYFEDICGIPHGSGNTQMISDYLVDFAKEHKLKYRQEDCGNVIIWKDATEGYEDAPVVMLQGHMDMVTVKTDDCDLDMDKEGLRLAITEDGQWLYAKQTSLGGDDGIAVAYSLAILADDTIPHPALEVVITVDEEVGLLGATALDASDLKSQIMLNMDSEEDGIFLTSCAGGATIECVLPAERVEKEGIVYEWRVDDLFGGHSGAEIHLGRASANIIFGRFLSQVREKVAFSLGDFYGGEKDNAIPVRCRAILVVDEENAAALEKECAAFADAILKENAFIETKMNFKLRKLEQTSASVMSDAATDKLTILLAHYPSGIQRMMPEIPDMVQTSLNMGIIHNDEKQAIMTFSVRSAVNSEKLWILKKLKDLTELMGGYIHIFGIYNAWEYNSDSKIQAIMSETFEEITGKKPVLTGIHAGVECGVFGEKLPGIDCISYGPGMRDIHTTRERLNIPSVKTNYELTLKVLEKIK